MAEIYQPRSTSLAKRVFRKTALALLVSAGLLSAPAAPARATDLIEQIESQYNNIFVYRHEGKVTMTFGHGGRYYTESTYNPFDELGLPVRYTRYMTMGVLYPQKLDNMLLIGLGGGRTSSYLHHFFPEMDITAIELDPKVLEVARTYFHLQEDDTFRVEIADGRSWVMRHDDRKFDMILLDAYRGPFVPFHLLTREFYQLLNNRLSEGGVVVQNIEPTTMLFDSALATMRSVFDHIDFYDAKGNVVAIAYQGAKKSREELQKRAEALQAEREFRHPLPGLLEDLHNYSAPIKADPLTDDFAPVNALRAIERHNLKWDE